MAVNVGELELAIRAGGTATTLRDLARVDAEAAKVGATPRTVRLGTAGGGAVLGELATIQARASAWATGMGTTLAKPFTMLGGLAKSSMGQLGLAFGAVGIGAGIVSGIGAAITAANAFNTSLRVLSSTSRILGVPLALLQTTSATLAKSLGLTATNANMMTAVAVRFTGAAGRMNDTGRFMTAWLDLAASRGLTAADAMQALETTIQGQDEGLNRLGLRNPSAIYKEWGAGADDASQKAAIVNEVLSKGALISGAYAEKMGTSAGAVERLKNAKESFLVALGQAILGQNNFGEGAAGMIGLFTTLTTHVENNRDAIGGWVVGIGRMISGLAAAIGWLTRLGDTLTAIDQASARAGQAVGRSLRFDLGAGLRPNFGDVAGGSSSGADFSDVIGTSQQIARATPAPRGRGTGAGTGGDNFRMPTLAGGPAGLTGIVGEQILGPLRSTLQPLPITVVPRMPAQAISAFTMRLNELKLRVEGLWADLMPNVAGGLTAALSAGITSAVQGGGFFEGFKNVLLESLGRTFSEMGQAMLMQGAILVGLLPALSNPLTSGPALLAAGAALVALGATLSAITGGRGDGGGGGGYGGGGYGGQVNASARATLTPRAAPVGGRNAPTGRDSTLATPQAVTVNVNAIGWDSPRVQRDVATAVQGAVARGFKLGGAM